MRRCFKWGLWWDSFCFFKLFTPTLLLVFRRARLTVIYKSYILIILVSGISFHKIFFQSRKQWSNSGNWLCNVYFLVPNDINYSFFFLYTPQCLSQVLRAKKTVNVFSLDLVLFQVGINDLARSNLHTLKTTLLFLLYNISDKYTQTQRELWRCIVACSKNDHSVKFLPTLKSYKKKYRTP